MHGKPCGAPAGSSPQASHLDPLVVEAGEAPEPGRSGAGHHRFVASIEHRDHAPLLERVGDADEAQHPWGRELPLRTEALGEMGSGTPHGCCLRSAHSPVLLPRKSPQILV